jgi:hypothetical protein
MTDSTRKTAGLWLLGLCSVLDLAVIGVPNGPPIGVRVLSAVLGVVSLVLVVRALRDAGTGIRMLAALRILSALSAVPAFFASGVSGTAVTAASVTVALNVSGLLLVAGPGRTAVVAP